jgi:quercetin dioxygenase-like cupin family protein
MPHSRSSRPLNKRKLFFPDEAHIFKLKAMKNGFRSDVASLGAIVLAFCGTLTAQTYTVTSPKVSAGRQPAEVRETIATPLPSMMRTHLRATLLEVTYPPGGSSAAHEHPCPVVGYVVLGAVRMKIKGDVLRTYRAGDSFYEPPNTVHEISANASNSEPAKFVAYFVCDTEAPLSSTVKDEGAH